MQAFHSKLLKLILDGRSMVRIILAMRYHTVKLHDHKKKYIFVAIELFEFCLRNSKTTKRVTTKAPYVTTVMYLSSREIEQYRQD